MAKLTGRTELSATPADGDLLHIVDVSDTTDNALGSSRKITVANLTGGVYKPSGTDVAVADGGTGASTASGARTNLGLAIGTDVQAYDQQLTDIAALTATKGKLIVADGTNYVSLAVGTNNQVLTADSAQTTGVKWAAASGTGDMLAANNLSDVASASTSRTNLGVYSTSQVDTLINAAAANVGKRGRVRAATTANITIATALNNGDTLDGVTLVTDDLILVKNQTAPEENGIYVVSASPARSTEFDTYNEHPGSLIGVEEGSTNADTLWLCTSNDGGTLNTTAIAFTKMVIAGELLAANNLSDVANASTARTNLGLAIGTDVQAYDAELGAIAGLTSAADKGIQFTGSGTAATYDLTTAGKALLDDADAAAQRTTLGLGTMSTQASSSVSISGGSVTGITDLAIADGGTGASTATAAFDALSPMTTAGDIIYGGASGTRTRLAIGTALQVLRTNAGATAPEWATISSGGQTTYDAIVAPSGGDYTTLGAALTAASNGWSIFVKEGTYSESAITSALTNLTIVGENLNTVTISMTTANLSLSGTGLNIRGLTISSSTGTVTMSGTSTICRDCYFTKTSTGDHLTFSGANSYFTNNKYLQNSATEASGRTAIVFSGNYQIITGNWIKSYDVNSNSAQGAIRFTGTYQNVENNHFDVTANGGRTFMELGGTRMRFVGNGILDSTGVSYAIIVTADNIIIEGNHIIDSSASNNINVAANNLILTGNYLTSNGCVTFTATSSSHTFTGNTFKGIGSTPVGINTGSQTITTSLFNDNTFDACTTAMSFGSGASKNTFSGNIIVGVGTSTTTITDAGIANSYFDNMGVPVVLENRFVNMKNTSGSTIAAGAVVTFKSTVAAGNEITTTTTASDNNVLGVATASITNNSFGYIQTRGKTTLLKADGTTDIAVGDFLTTFTTAEIAAKAAAGNLAFAYALEAFTTDASTGVLDAMLIEPRRL